MTKNNITLAITGASGALYALALIRYLVQIKYNIHLIISDAGRTVLSVETALKLDMASYTQQKQILLDHFQAETHQITLFNEKDWFSPAASGSSASQYMVVCPASMGVISAIANGASNNLIERAADVVIKEKGNLIMVPRETPFSEIHLKNMLSLTQMGVTILPAAPGFYHKPESVGELVDFIVFRILKHMNIKADNEKRWCETEH